MRREAQTLKQARAIVEKELGMCDSISECSTTYNEDHTEIKGFDFWICSYDECTDRERYKNIFVWKAL